MNTSINDMTQTELKEYYKKIQEEIAESIVVLNIKSHKEKLTIQEEMIRDLLSEMLNTIVKEIEEFDINYNKYLNDKPINILDTIKNKLEKMKGE